MVIEKNIFIKQLDLALCKYPPHLSSNLLCSLHCCFQVLEAFLAPGSELWMLNEVPEKEREKKLNDGGLDISRLENLKLVHREGNAVIRRHLENLPLETFDSVSFINSCSLSLLLSHLSILSTKKQC